MKKRFVLVFIGVHLFAFGQETQTVGNFKFIITETWNDKVITITGYTGTDSILRIPSAISNIPVTEIGEKAFMMNKHIMEVILPDTMECIGERAFYGCSNLKKINIPEQLRGIDWGAFEDPNNEILDGMDENIRDELIAKFYIDIFYYPEDIYFSDTYYPDFQIGYIGMAGVGPIVAKALVNPANYRNASTNRGVFKTTCIETSESRGTFTVKLSLSRDGKEITRATFSMRSRVGYYKNNYVTYLYVVNTEAGRIFANFRERGDPVELSVKWIDPFLDMIGTFYDTEKLLADL